MAAILITVQVDTVNVTQDNLGTMCTISQTGGNFYNNPVDSKQFISYLLVQDTITWNATPKYPGDRTIINVTSVHKDSGSRIFKDILPGALIGGGAFTTASLVQPTTDDPEGYTIQFDFDGKFFHFDPKIQVHTPPSM
jgi:hypothetical protein